ncbi:Putative zinc transporter 8 [Verticillium dahliae VDG2]|nr:Putative zinc transporter 8 [Verticillium dahliae VDG2]
MSAPFLDHLVILLPHAALISPPEWLRSAFHLYPGGQHADNRTANTLVLLPDGTYLELIAFLPHAPPAARASHPWGREPDGHLTGGRTQKDGTEIRWATSFPEAAAPSVPFTRGELPFWALDVSVSSREALEVYALIQGVEGRPDEDGWTVWDLAAPEGPPSALRVRVRDGTAAGGKEKIKLTILTERGTEAKRIGGEIAEGVELWIDLEPET